MLNLFCHFNVMFQVSFHTQSVLYVGRLATFLDSVQTTLEVCILMEAVVRNVAPLNIYVGIAQNSRNSKVRDRELFYSIL